MKTCLKCGYMRQASDTAPDYECPKCGVVYAKFQQQMAPSAPDEHDAGRAMNVASEPQLRRSARDEARPVANIRDSGFSGFSQRQLYGLVGAVILAIGVFMPLMSGPLGMNMNYFDNGKGDGTFVLIMAGLSAALIFTRQFRLLWVTGGVSLGVIAFTFFRLQSKIAEVKATVDGNLKGNPFRGFADAAMQSVQMQWGWIVLIIGAVLILLCAWMRDRRS